MPDYKKMYHIMFNAATDAEQLAKKASEILQKAQTDCEEIYLESKDTQIMLHTTKSQNKAAEV